MTGSLEEGETHRQAAAREVREETGIACEEADLIDLRLTNRFAIAPQWLHRYAPGVTHNEEVCFALPTRRVDVRVDALEHDDYAWLTYEEALGRFIWESNRKALAAAAAGVRFET